MVIRSWGGLAADSHWIDLYLHDSYFRMAKLLWKVQEMASCQSSYALFYRRLLKNANGMLLALLVRS